MHVAGLFAVVLYGVWLVFGNVGTRIFVATMLGLGAGACLLMVSEAILDMGRQPPQTNVVRMAPAK